MDQLQKLQRKVKMWLVDLIWLEKRRRITLRKISLQISAVQGGGMCPVFSPVSFSPVSVSYHNTSARGSERHPGWGALSNKRRMKALLTLTWRLNGQGAFSDEPLPTGFDWKRGSIGAPNWIDRGARMEREHTVDLFGNISTFIPYNFDNKTLTFQHFWAKNTAKPRNCVTTYLNLLNHPRRLRYIEPGMSVHISRQ